MWQLADLLNWNKNIAGLADLAVSAIPVLAIMWSLGLIAGCILLIVPSTQALGTRCLAGSLALWVCITVVAAVVQFSHGASYTSHIEIVIGAAYLSSGLTFGLVLVPLLVTRLAWFGIAKYRSLKIAERTVEFHVSNVLGKLKVASRVAAVVWVKDHGLDDRPAG